jgi:nucleoside-diphosphate-sugar epimerase
MLKLKLSEYSIHTDQNASKRWRVSNFIVQAFNQDITVYGQGNQTRSFQYVDDLVEGMIRLMNSKDSLLDL